MIYWFGCEDLTVGRRAEENHAVVHSIADPQAEPTGVIVNAEAVREVPNAE